MPFLLALPLAAALAFCPAWALAQPKHERPRHELIYGAELMTPQERDEYRRRFHDAGEPKAQEQVRARHRERMRERARTRGMELREPDGVVGKPAGRR